MTVCSIHIKDVKEIAKQSKDWFGIDLGDIIYVTLKIKIEQFCKTYKLTSSQNLIEKLNTIPALRDDFLSFIFFDEFELFRDPAFWRSIKESILTQVKTDIQFRVFFPSCHQGAELLSFLILREDLGLADKIQVLFASQHKLLNKVGKGFVYEERKHHLNISNYKRLEGEDNLDKYFVQKMNKLVPEKKLFRNTMYFDYNETEGAFRKSVNLIIYRNKLLNYNSNLQLQITNHLIKKIKLGGYLALGVKEKLIDDNNRELFIVFNKKESLYKKKI